MAVFTTLAYLYEKTGEQTYLPWLDSWAEWAMHDLERTRFGGMQHVTYVTTNDQELWDDTLMMTVLPLAKIGQLLHRPHYIEEAKRQVLLHLQYLLDPTTGLFFHGWKFHPAASPNTTTTIGHNFARARWARGNAWLTIFIPDFLDLLDLPPTDAFRTHLVAVLTAQCTALRQLQTADGAWRTLLDVPLHEGSYVEASATAGFAYGILKGVRKRYLVGGDFEAVALRAVRAVIDRIAPDGELRDVSFGTAMGADLQHYKEIPRTAMPYGQAMAIMMLAEFLRKFV
jgi:unsaturated rhamnogalacturonyl hydrolase